MVADNVKYRAKMRTLRYVFGREMEKDFFKRAALFEKVDAYAYEKEFRIVALLSVHSYFKSEIPNLGNSAVIQAMLIANPFDFLFF